MPAMTYVEALERVAKSANAVVGRPKSNPAWEKLVLALSDLRDTKKAARHAN